MRSLISNDCELQARMMSILPLRLHPAFKQLNMNVDIDDICTEEISFSCITYHELLSIMHWFVSKFKYDCNAMQFYCQCPNYRNHRWCAISQLTEIIIGCSNSEMFSISHLNQLFIALLWSLKIPARFVHTLRPIHYNPSKNLIYDRTYDETVDEFMQFQPCVCQKIDHFSNSNTKRTVDHENV